MGRGERIPKASVHHVRKLSSQHDKVGVFVSFFISLLPSTFVVETGRVRGRTCISQHAEEKGDSFLNGFSFSIPIAIVAPPLQPTCSLKSSPGGPFQLISHYECTKIVEHIVKCGLALTDPDYNE